MAANGTTTFTPQQDEAIRTIGKRLLVSAAAGSGKTSVLAERCAYLVCDAPPEQRCDVTDLLVVTFTEAAAAEMRSRIARALHKRYEAHPDDRLARQLALIDRAQISTIHGFCMRVLRQHFHALNLDPNFDMLSEEEGRLLRSEVAKDVFADRYERDECGAFQRLVDRYGDGNDESLRYRMMHTHALLGSLAQPKVWVRQTRDRISEAANQPLEKSELGRNLSGQLTDQLRSIHERLVDLITRLQTLDRLAKYQDFATELLAAVTAWSESFDQGGLDALASMVTETSWQRLPTVKNLSSAEDSLKCELVEIRDAMKAGELFALSRFSEAEWRTGMAATIEPANLLLDLVEEFGARYRDSKDQLRVLDFTDLEQLALEALGRQVDDKTFAPTIAAESYRGQFKHVLVDEYQDVNELQDTILSLVSHEQPVSNFFCVGDVKQSIYRFRLADPHRFLRMHTDLKLNNNGRGGVIDLQTNFRSRAELLETVNGVFERLMTRESAEILYDDSHAMRPPEDSAYRSLPQTDARVELHLLAKPSRADDESAEGGSEADDLDQAEREAAFVVSRIRQLLGQDGGTPTQILTRDDAGQLTPRAIRLGDIAMLLRSMKYKAEHFADILRGSGIAVHSDSGGGFFASTEVQDVVALLKVLDNQRQDIPLAALLRSPIASIADPEDALAKIRLAFPDVPYHVAVVHYAKNRADELAAQLRDFLDVLQDWRELASRRPLAEVLWHIYDESGYLAFCEGLDDGAQRVANLLALHERARQFSSFKQQGISRFLRFLDLLRDEVDDVGQPSVASEADDAVRIMSVHRAKGLEFPVVIMPDLGKRHNLSDCSGSILVERTAGIGLAVCDDERRIRYPSLASTIVAERLRRQSLAEEMRVLYVAMTRAREQLILLGSYAPKKLEDWRRRWSAHAGALPADDVLRASTMLDWIGPALACMNGNAKYSFAIHSHDSTPTENVAHLNRPALTPLQRSLARLEPISPSVQDHRADDVWQRLTRAYPHQPFKKMQASAAVTSLDRHALEVESRDSRNDEFIRSSNPLRRARALLEQSDPSALLLATDIGAATHVLLEHLDYRSPCSLDDLKQQVESLIERRLLISTWRDCIDLASIEWLVNQTPLGGMLREHASILLRELPINFPMPPDFFDKNARSGDPLDRVMVRGRIDALLPLHRCAILIDFKTDQLRSDVELSSRATLYQPQLNHYRRAVKSMLGCESAQTHLVFLKARRIFTS